MMRKTRLAKMEERMTVKELYRATIQWMRGIGIDQWDELYPTGEIITRDIEREQLHVIEQHGKIAAVFVLNQECDPEYAEGQWHYPEASYGILHRLCVHPAHQGSGLGRQAVLAAEQLLRDQGKETMRLDVYSGNPAAVHLYEKLEYQHVGEVTFRKGKFLLMEKKL